LKDTSIPAYLITLEANVDCNLNCSFCWLAELKKQKRFSTGYARKYVPPSEYIKFITSIESTFGKPISICWTGGEPLLRQDVFEVSRFLKSHGEYVISMVTNGTLVTINRFNDIFNYLDIVIFSIDGLATSHDLMRNKNGVFDITCNNLNALIKERNIRQSKLQVWTYMVISSLNVFEIEEYASFMWKLGVDKLLLRPFEWGNKKDRLYREFGLKPKHLSNLDVVLKLKRTFGEDFIDLDENFLERIKMFVKEKESEPLKCYAGNHFISINCFGEIFPCPKFPTHNLPSDFSIPLKNVSYNKLDDIIRQIKTYFCKVYNPCSCCLYYHNYLLNKALSNQ
jgi:sulfatase maturation enzyme AslB (radical SAM superfamily)